MSDQSSTSTASPAPILRIATGYMAAKQLFAASRIGLFAALSDGPADARDLASRTGVSQRVVRILAEGMAAHGLLHRHDGQYRLDGASAAYLVDERSELDLAPFLRFLNEISYGHWRQFDDTVDSECPGDLAMTDDRWATFMAGVMTYNELHARMLARALDFNSFGNILDLGGISSAFTIEALRANPRARARLVFGPDAAESLRADLAAAGLSDRTSVEGAATTLAEPEGAFDLVMLNHVAHRFSAEENIRILRGARAAAAEDARLVLLDFFLDDDPQQRPIDALHAAEYLVIDGTVVYPHAQVLEWLAETGWQQVELLELPGSPRALLAKAV